MGAGAVTGAVTGAVGVFPIHCFGSIGVSRFGVFRHFTCFLGITIHTVIR